MKKFFILILSIIFIAALISAQDDILMPGMGDDAMGAEPMDLAADPSIDAYGTEGEGSPFAGDDPFAGMDMGEPEGEDPTAGMDAGGGDVLMPDMGGEPAGEDPLAGMDMGALEGEDPLAGMDMGTLPGEDADSSLFPEMGEGEPAAGGDVMGLPGEGMDMGAGVDPLAGIDTAPPVDESPPPLPKPKKKKAAVYTVKSTTATDFVYTIDGDLGDIRTLRDYMTWGLKASSTLKGKYAVSKLNDNNSKTAWLEGRPSKGVGQSITLKFDEIFFAPIYEKKRKRVKINKFLLLNGFCKDRETWEQFNRARKFKIYKNKSVICNVVLRDTANWQTINLKRPIWLGPGDRIRIKVTGVFPEVRHSRDTQLAISELVPVGGM